MQSQTHPKAEAESGSRETRRDRDHPKDGEPAKAVKDTREKRENQADSTREHTDEGKREERTGEGETIGGRKHKAQSQALESKSGHPKP